jgi:flagellin
MLSIQTNVDSLIAQQNLNINNQFQSNTIQQLTSGYRINSAGDDAAGLAVANQYRDQIAELNQGVLNANDGASQLQIMDGGLDNISTMLDRLQTLATESASSTFTGDRSTLQNEYSNLLSEVDRQANNIGLGAADSSNLRNIGVYIGGGQDANNNSTVNVDLSSNSGVGTVALGIAQTSVLTNAAVVIGGANAVTASAVQATDTATFNFQTAAGAAAAIVITGQTGDTLQDQVNELNTDLQNQNLSITASLNAAGQLQFQSSDAFSVNATTATTGGAHPDNLVSGTPANATANNTGLNNLEYTGTTGANSADYDVQITVGTTKVVASLTGGLTQTPAGIQANVATINSQLKAAGITTVSAVVDQTTTGAPGTVISFQGSGTFSVGDDAAVAGTFVNNGNFVAGAQGTGPQTAINAITAAISALGQTQGKIGAGENTLNYAINLAQSQITNFSSAESQIRDANVAQEAANLTKAQVLQQTSIAAMAQANAEPQALLKLFQ